MPELNRCEITHSPPRRRYKQLDALQREEISIGVSLGMSHDLMAATANHFGALTASSTSLETEATLLTITGIIINMVMSSASKNALSANFAYLLATEICTNGNSIGQHQ